MAPRRLTLIQNDMPIRSRKPGGISETNCIFSSDRGVRRTLQSQALPREPEELDAR